MDVKVTVESAGGTVFSSRCYSPTGIVCLLVSSYPYAVDETSSCSNGSSSTDFSSSSSSSDVNPNEKLNPPPDPPFASTPLSPSLSEPDAAPPVPRLAISQKESCSDALTPPL